MVAGQASAELTSDAADWHLDFDKEGIKIFTKSQGDSDYHAFKAEATLNAPIQDIMAVMATPGSCVEWVHGCIESWGLKEESFNKRYAYSVNDLPWPVQDRDYVIEISTSNDPATQTIFMDIVAVEDQLPPKSQYVRVTRQETHYQFSPVGENQTRMVWLQHTDPAGALPSWLVNALIVDIPFKSMKALENVAKDPKYANGQIIYNAAGLITGVKSKALADATPVN